MEGGHSLTAHFYCPPTTSVNKSLQFSLIFPGKSEKRKLVCVNGATQAALISDTLLDREADGL